MTSIVLELKNVGFDYGTLSVIDKLDLTVRAGELLVCVGPSGCGKSTLLALLGGHLAPTRGKIDRRGASRTIYQDGGLFPWRTVLENVRLGLRHVTDAGLLATRADELLDLVGMASFAGHYPHQLSGGMRQRVELARALAGDTDLLLMDEPFSALDYLTRLRMRAELARLLREQPRTVVLVTHDIEEAAQLADRVLVLSGRPSRVRDEVRLDAPRPRAATDPAVVAAVHRVLTEMGLEHEPEAAAVAGGVEVP